MLSNRSRLTSLALLYGVQATNILLPLVTVPYLSRILGADGWGQVAAIQSLFLFLSFIVEYGFNFSGTRKLASLGATDIDKFSRIFYNVQYAKLILSSFFIAASAIIFTSIPVFREDKAVFFWGMFNGLVQGWSPLWYFQGTNRLPFAAWVEIAGRCLSVILIFILVQNQTDGYLFLLISATCVASSYLVLNSFALKETRFNRFTLSEVMNELKSGFSMFFFRFIGSLYTSANSALLRVVSPAAQVAYYSGSDKIFGGAKVALLPINQLSFPRMSYLVEHDQFAAKKMFNRILALLLGGSIVVALLLWPLVPWLVVTILGQTFAPAAEVLRIMLLALPVIALSNSFGMQWLLPNKLDFYFNVVISISAVINIFSIFLLARKLGAVGAAYSMLISETFVTLGFIFVSLKFTKLYRR